MRVSRYLTVFGLSLLALGTLLFESGCNQTSGYVMNESGKGFYAQGNYTAARREFERALMDSPENPNYAFNVASAMKKQGDLIGAERMYQRALNLDPRHQPAHHEMASMLKEQGREEQAAAHIQEWVATQPYQPNAHIEQAWMQKQHGDLAGAEQSLRLALQQKPNHPAAMAQLADVYQQTGRSQEAHAMYRRSLALNPFQPEVRARVSGLRGTQHAQPQTMASYAPPIQQFSQSAMPLPGASPIQQASYYQPQPQPYQPQQLISQQMMAPQMMPPQSSQSPVMQAGGILQSHPPTGQPMMQGTASQAFHPMSQNFSGQSYGPIVNAPQLHGPMTMSSVPIVSPF